MSDSTTFAPVSPAVSGRKGPQASAPAHIIVIGAGAFGGWSALHLRRAGFRVTLIDAWGPGNSRSSSGDETRVVRSTYGANQFYFDLNVRSVEVLSRLEAETDRQFFYPTGALWFCYEEKNPIVDDSIPFAAAHGKAYRYLSKAELRDQFTIIHAGDLHHAWFDPFAGYVKARESCQAVRDQFCREGGTFLQAHVSPGLISNLRLHNIVSSAGRKLEGDFYLFACGSWLGHLFPDVAGKRVTCTRQEVYYFGTPVAHAATYDALPVWVDLDGKEFYYGIAGNNGRGFKIGVDKRGPLMDPDTEERKPAESVLRAARSFIGHRFPGLRDAPLVESRVCPYESSSDGNFLFDAHPQAQNCWLLGGGSGHGFKHGPGLGELVADIFSGKKDIPGLFGQLT